MKTNDIISANEARNLVEKYGVMHTIIDGAVEESLKAEEIENTDRFKVVINYGNEVQLHLISDDMRCEVSLKNLKGRCEGMEWIA